MSASEDSLKRGNSALKLMIKSIYVVIIFIIGFWVMLKFMDYPGGEIKLRAIPYPYKAGLSFAGDITGINSAEEFLSLQQYLCTEEFTPWGRGLGLELGAGFCFYDFTGESQFTLLDTAGELNSNAAQIIIDFIRSGYIDILNGYGNIPDSLFSDELLDKGLNVLEVENLSISIWINPPGDRFNYCLGSIPNQLGDNPGSPFYHTPYLTNAGIRYIESSNYTHVVGQDVRFGFKGFLKKNYELFFSIMKSSKSDRWDVSRENLLLQPFMLDDSTEFFRFNRFIDGNPASVPEIIDVKFLAQQLKKEVLDNLVLRNGYMILYTNYGENTSYNEWIPIEARQALIDLAKRADDKEILVTTTSRLLNYNLVRKYLNWHWKHDNDIYNIYIDGIDLPFEIEFDLDFENLGGLTFHTPEPQNTRIFYDGKIISPININPADENGLFSVSIPWIWLNYPSGY